MSHLPLRTALLAFGRDERGSLLAHGAVLIAVVLLPLMLGLWDYGRVILAQTRLTDAINVAMTQTLNAPESWDETELRETVRQVMGIDTVNLSAVEACFCPGGDGSGGLAEASCTSSCADGTEPGSYAHLVVTWPASVALISPWAHANPDLQAEGYVRVE